MKKKNSNKITTKSLTAAMIFTMCIGMIMTAVLFVSMIYLSNHSVDFKESSSTSIKEIVANATASCFNGLGDGVGDYCVAKSLFDWEISNITYTQQLGVLSADETLKIRSGDCADLSVLYCSLAKQAMIDCYYIQTKDHMFNYIVFDDKVYVVDIANQKFDRIW